MDRIAVAMTVLSSIGVNDTLSKAKDMTLKAKTKDMMYDAKSKALQKLYLGNIARNHTK